MPSGRSDEVVAAAVLEEVHLLVDDVGALGAGAQEDAGVLEDGRLESRRSRKLSATRVAVSRSQRQ